MKHLLYFLPVVVGGGVGRGYSKLLLESNHILFTILELRHESKMIIIEFD